MRGEPNEMKNNNNKTKTCRAAHCLTMNGRVCACICVIFHSQVIVGRMCIVLLPRLVVNLRSGYDVTNAAMFTAMLLLVDAVCSFQHCAHAAFSL